MYLKIANDNGNSEQDLIIDDELIQQPNVFAKLMRLPNLDDVVQENVLKDIHNQLLVSIEGGLYYIGQRALDSGLPCHTIEVGIDNNKLTSDIVYINILKNEGHKYHDTALEFVTPALEIQAEEILHKAKQVIQQANNEIDVVCVYGVSIMMRSALEKKLQDYCDRAMIKLLYIPEEYAVTLEVKGLNVFLHSKIFDIVKKATLEQA